MKIKKVIAIILSIIPLLGLIAFILWRVLKAKGKDNTEIANIMFKTHLSVVAGVFAVAIVISAVVTDNSCERCNKEGIYKISSDKYCEKHYLEVLGELIEWDGD